MLESKRNNLSVAFPSSTRIQFYVHKEKNHYCGSWEPKKSNPTSTFIEEGKESKEAKWLAEDDTIKQWVRAWILLSAVFIFISIEFHPKLYHTIKLLTLQAVLQFTFSYKSSNTVSMVNRYVALPKAVLFISREIFLKGKKLKRNKKWRSKSQKTDWGCTSVAKGLANMYNTLLGVIPSIFFLCTPPSKTQNRKWTKNPRDPKEETIY
jgi:hypothetical protein